MKFKRIIRKITHSRKIEINQSAEIRTFQFDDQTIYFLLLLL